MKIKYKHEAESEICIEFERTPSDYVASTDGSYIHTAYIETSTPMVGTIQIQGHNIDLLEALADKIVEALT